MAGVYLHIPFCKKFCRYCDFYHIPLPQNVSSYVAALLKEMVLRRDYLSGEKVSTIYFGGGTPSILSVGDIEKLLSAIFKCYNVDIDSEITIELNPDDLTKEYLTSLKQLPINRLSVGIQSWSDKELSLMNRRHTVDGARAALENCFEAGFSNVSADLIYGIPGSDISSWEHSLDTMLSFDITHLSAYHLTIEEGTTFHKMKREGNLKEVAEEMSLTQYNMLINKMQEAGFEHYEISNFCKTGCYSRHNTSYWQQIPYLGLGASSHSYDGVSRRWNVSDVRLYIDSIEKGVLSFEEEILSNEMRYNEYILTSLRTKWGIDLKVIERLYGSEFSAFAHDVSKRYIDRGSMVLDGDRLKLTERGIMISDSIIEDFFILGE